MSISGKAVIAGIGATDFSKDSGRSELRLAAEAVLDLAADKIAVAVDAPGADSVAEASIAVADRARTHDRPPADSSRDEVVPAEASQGVPDTRSMTSPAAMPSTVPVTRTSITV